MLSYLKRSIQPKRKKKIVGKPFNPNFDYNVFAWYDGDVGLSTGGWQDRKGYTPNNLTFFNSPSVVTNDINGHDAIRFDGVNQYGVRATLLENEPITNYIVFKINNWVNGDVIFDTNNTMLRMTGSSPNLSIYAGTADINSNPDASVGNYEIFCCKFNSANSLIRTNNNSPVTGNPGTGFINGINLAKDSSSTVFSDINVAYWIIRLANDSSTIQNIIINYLKNRFAI